MEAQRRQSGAAGTAAPAALAERIERDYLNVDQRSKQEECAMDKVKCPVCSAEVESLVEALPGEFVCEQCYEEDYKGDDGLVCPQCGFEGLFKESLDETDSEERCWVEVPDGLVCPKCGYHAVVRRGPPEV